MSKSPFMPATERKKRDEVSLRRIREEDPSTPACGLRLHRLPKTHWLYNDKAIELAGQGYCMLLILLEIFPMNVGDDVEVKLHFRVRIKGLLSDSISLCFKANRRMGIATNRYRFVVMAVGLMCLTSICSNYIIINFTFICMREDMSEVVETGNGTFRSAYDYTQSEKSAIIWAVAAGTIVGTFPVNYLYIKHGAR
ncbi:hypothetical protein COOONC_09601 [Cooperia oncophora]